jgi:hypothetical protein
MERATILEDGFAWNGATYSSLSRVSLKGHDGAVECHFAFLLVLGGDASTSECGAQ